MGRPMRKHCNDAPKWAPVSAANRHMMSGVAKHIALRIAYHSSLAWVPNEQHWPQPDITPPHSQRQALTTASQPIAPKLRLGFKSRLAHWHGVFATTEGLGHALRTLRVGVAIDFRDIHRQKADGVCCIPDFPKHIQRAWQRNSGCDPSRYKSLWTTIAGCQIRSGGGGVICAKER